MVLNHYSVSHISEEASCPYCDSDLVIREEGGLILLLCVHCSFCEC